jgi:hypothetical protein
MLSYTFIQCFLYGAGFGSNRSKQRGFEQKIAKETKRPKTRLSDRNLIFTSLFACVVVTLELVPFQVLAPDSRLTADRSQQRGFEQKIAKETKSSKTTFSDRDLIFTSFFACVVVTLELAPFQVPAGDSRLTADRSQQRGFEQKIAKETKSPKTTFSDRDLIFTSLFACVVVTLELAPFQVPAC